MSCRLVRVILRRPSSPFDQIVDRILDLSAVEHFFNLPFVLGVFEVRHCHKALIVVSAAVGL
jgi:hypothetical protein